MSRNGCAAGDWEKLEMLYQGPHRTWCMCYYSTWLVCDKTWLDIMEDEMVQCDVASGQEHGVLLNQRWGCGVSEVMSRHPTYKELHDVVSETQHPQVRNVRFCLLTWQVWFFCVQVGALAHRGHGVSHESLVDGRGLNVWHNDDGVFP